MGIIKRLLSLFKPQERTTQSPATLTEPQIKITFRPVERTQDTPMLRGTDFESETPEGMRYISRNTMVAGISRREEAASDFVLLGIDRKLELERETDNPVDPNAIKVIAVWNGRREHIGYVPKEIAAKVAEKYSDRSLAAGLTTILPPDCDHATPGVRFTLYVSKADKKKSKAAKIS